ncbi:MAG: TraR/DksA C4-type zinc finger protein [Dehalococcoidales bacterium]|nr:TraR/DksA C4-type zinc finger protein [Dehalococcoidales bacterium]
MKIPEIRKLLENEHKRLTIEFGLHSDPDLNGDRPASPFNKKMEAASQITELEQRLIKVRRIKQQLADIEHALEKIDKGTYSLCDNCGKPIAEARLKAIPQASLCLECKSSQNRTLLGAYAK